MKYTTRIENLTENAFFCAITDAIRNGGIDPSKAIYAYMGFETFLEFSHCTSRMYPSGDFGSAVWQSPCGSVQIQCLKELTDEITISN